MNFRSPLASCGDGGSLAEPPARASAGFSARAALRVAPGRKPPGNLGGSLLERSRRGGGAPIVLENSAAPSGKWPPAGGGSGCPRQGAQRERAEPGPASPGLRSPEARPGRGSSSPQSLLPPDRWPGSTAPTGPRSLGRAPGLSDPGAALVSPAPPGIRVLGTCSRPGT